MTRSQKMLMLNDICTFALSECALNAECLRDKFYTFKRGT
jgi:hypothetical protein